MNDWILITGFGTFPGVDVNPTAILMRNLQQFSIPNIQLKSLVLDVSFTRSAEQIKTMLNSEISAPLIMLHFGVCRSPKIRIETRAVNSKSASIPDVDGVFSQQEPIDFHRGLDDVLYTTVDVEALVSHLKKNGYEAFVSDDAGRYVCNSTYYNVLNMIQDIESRIDCVFVHVPPKNCPLMLDDGKEIIWTEQFLLESAIVIVRWLLQTRSKIQQLQ